jgi:hypothetical protein
VVVASELYRSFASLRTTNGRGSETSTAAVAGLYAL